MRNKQGYVYILSNEKRGTLYIGVTSNLQQRLEQHRSHAVDGFTKKYDLRLLVHFEQSESITSAIAREKQLKKWNRSWKIDLIEYTNPDWKDLNLNINFS